MEIAEMLFDRWRSSLEDKNLNNRYRDFESLFQEMYEADIPKTSAYEYVKLAVREYLPNASIISSVYRNVKRTKHEPRSEQEFASDWKKSIETDALKAFFAYYPDVVEKTARKKPQPKLAEYYGAFDEVTNEEIQARRRQYERILAEDAFDPTVLLKGGAK